MMKVRSGLISAGERHAIHTEEDSAPAQRGHQVHALAAQGPPVQAWSAFNSSVSTRPMLRYRQAETCRRVLEERIQTHFPKGDEEQEPTS